MSNKSHIVRTLWRWNTGAPMDGEIRADPGWFTWGDHIMHRTGKVYSWHRMPRVYRMGVRQGINLYLVGLPASLLFLGAAITEALYGVLTFAVIGLAGWLIVRRGRRYLKNTRTVTPLAAALAIKFGVAPAVAEKSLHFDKHWTTLKAGRLLVVDIPSHFAAIDGERTTVEHLIGNRLGRDCSFTWHTSKGKGGGTITVNVSPPLPKLVLFRDYLVEIGRNKPGEYVVGVKAGGVVDRQTIMGEFPHFGCCFGSGFGKSSFLTCVICQLMVQNPLNHFVVIDTKMDSLEHLRGLSQIDIWADPEHIEDMVNACKNVYTVMRERQKAQQADPTLRGTWPVEGLVMEEVNDFSSQLIAWWQRTGHKGNPTLWRDVIGPILWQGRAVNVHLFVVAQNLLDRFFGNMSLRPSLTPLYMSGYKPAQYRAMVGTPIIKSRPGKGRVLVTDGSEEYWVQTLYDETDYFVKWVNDSHATAEESTENVNANE